LIPVLEADVVAAEGPPHVVRVAETAEGEDTPDQGIIETVWPRLNSAGGLLGSWVREEGDIHAHMVRYCFWLC